MEVLIFHFFYSIVHLDGTAANVYTVYIRENVSVRVRFRSPRTSTERESPHEKHRSPRFRRRHQPPGAAGRRSARGAGPRPHLLRHLLLARRLCAGAGGESGRQDPHPPQKRRRPGGIHRPDGRGAPGGTGRPRHPRRLYGHFRPGPPGGLSKRRPKRPPGTDPLLLRPRLLRPPCP